MVVVGIAIEPVRSTVLEVNLSRHRNMLVSESFLISLIEIYGRHILYIHRWWWNMVSLILFFSRTEA
jgi:hypothetical protein